MTLLPVLVKRADALQDGLGDRIAPVSLAQIAGMVGIEIARLRWFADRGYLAWDPATRTVIATVPIDVR